MAATATANQAILNRLQSFQRIHPATADLFADWTLEPGDIVTVQSGEDSFSVPVYQMNLEWRGDSTVQVQSTGSEKRPPLSELKRRSYASGRRQEVQEQELIRHQADIETSNERILLWATEDEWDEIQQDWQQTGKSQFEVTATEIASKVSNTTYQSYISQTATKLALVVGGTDTNPTVNTGSILLAINGDGTTSAGINADKIFLVGNTTLAGQLTVQDGALRVKTALLVSGSTNGNVSVNNGTVSAYEHQVNTNGRVRFVGSGTGERYDLTASVVSGLISSLSLTGPVNNEYTLSWTTVGNSTPQTKNFSRATALSGVWNSGILTVEASPQGEYYYDYLSKGTETRNGVDYSIPVTHCTSPNGVFTNTGYTISLNAQDVWDEGYLAGGGGQVITPTISTTWGGGAQSGMLSINTTPAALNPTEMWFSGGSITWNGNNGTLPVCVAGSQHDPAVPQFNLTVDATARYTQGLTDGEASVTVDTITGTAIGASATKDTNITATATASNSAFTTETLALSKTTYTFTSGGTSKTNNCVDLTLGGTTVGRIDTQSVYTAGETAGNAAGIVTGRNSVVINKGSWSGGEISFTKSVGTASTKSVKLTAASATWSGTTASVAIWDGEAADAQHGDSTGYSVSVDAASKLTTTTVTPTTSQQTITPGSGYIGFSEVTINAASSGVENVHHIGLDSGKNHNGSWWNCLVYDASGNTLKTINTDGSSSGLYFPVAGKRITANGTYTASSDATISGIAAYSQVVVDVEAEVLNNDSRLGNFEWRSSGSIAGRTHLSTLTDLIKNHKNDRGYIFLEGYVVGGTGANRKYYITIG